MTEMTPEPGSFAYTSPAHELAQAEGIKTSDIINLTRAVYKRSPGFPAQEMGGVMVCALGWGAATGKNVMALAEQELARIEAIPAEKFRERHRVKADAGYAKPAALEARGKP